MSTDFWNNRYSQEEFVYGELPNEYFRKVISGIKPGSILLPAEGEGRNAVYAATSGWSVIAFDQSPEGRRKATWLAQKNKVIIDYTVSNVEDFAIPKASVDAIALIYAHFPGERRREYHQKLASFLKQNGVLILEGFSKQHAEMQEKNPAAGGPKDLAMLYDLEDLKGDFPDFDFTEAYEAEIELKEGTFHDGRSGVIRITGVKTR